MKDLEKENGRLTADDVPVTLTELMVKLGAGRKGIGETRNGEAWDSAHRALDRLSRKRFFEGLTEV